MSSLIKKIAPIALSIVAPYAAPALGITSALGTAALGAGLGAAGGALSGGGLKSALLGGVTGGIGGYAGAGGFGNAAGTTLAEATGKAGLQGATQGSGIVGAVTRNIPSGLGSALKTAVSGDSGTLLSGVQSYMAQDDAEEQLRKAQGRAQEALSPYLSAGTSGIDALKSGFDPSQITNDAGYQFRLQQGNQALERSLAAKGMGDSGAALKAAQDYGQGLASQSYNDAFNQWLQKNSGLANYGANATGTLVDTYGNLGNIGANAAIAKSNVMTGTLSNLLRGTKIVGYDENGKPIYAE